MLRTKDEAEDAVQEAVVSTLVRVGIGNPCAYCKRAVYTQCINILRRNKRVIHTDEIAANVADAEAESVPDIGRALASLSEIERALVGLHFEGGWSLKQLAGLTDQSEITMRRQMKKIIDKLRKRIYQ